MNNTITAALIVAAGIVVAVGLYIYFSPYQQCVRSQVEQSRELVPAADYNEDFARNAARVSCARNSN